MSILFAIGGILILVGWIWNIITSFKMGGTLWGVLNIFLQPIMGIVSAVMGKTAWPPVGVMILGIILYFIGGGMTAMSSY
ncbi:hypothetical protein J4558_19120 [Leptolyngbya sp. 15MV]|nr:hypothetical protein J4558_19120 [Leptolyngbya sp. 15MV]